VDPELNDKVPPDPPIPELLLLIITMPPLAAAPSPDRTLAIPPLPRAFGPGTALNAPAEPLEPLPAERRIVPPRPPVATDDPIAIDPELLSLLDPETNESCPLPPPIPPLTDRTLTTPLLATVPSAASKFTVPPLDNCPWPEYAKTAPPNALVPAPTLMQMSPPQPLVEADDPSKTPPLLPNIDEPEL